MTPLKTDLNIAMLHGAVSGLTKKLEDAEKRIEKLEKTVRDILRTAHCLQPED